MALIVRELGIFGLNFSGSTYVITIADAAVPVGRRVVIAFNSALAFGDHQPRRHPLREEAVRFVAQQQLGRVGRDLSPMPEAEI